jgi:hypothetical protein
LSMNLNHFELPSYKVQPFEVSVKLLCFTVFVHEPQ